jgi:hypothetical protein
VCLCVVSHASQSPSSPTLPSANASSCFCVSLLWRCSGLMEQTDFYDAGFSDDDLIEARSLRAAKVAATATPPENAAEPGESAHRDAQLPPVTTTEAVTR